MVDFINPFRGTDPTAQAIADLGKAMFGNSGERDKNTAQLYALNRGNVEMDNYAKRIAAAGASGALADPQAQASLFLSGYKPSDAADLGLAAAANGFGAEDPRTVNAQIGAGQSFSATAPAFNATLAENRRQFDQTPTAVIQDGQPSYVPRVGAFGMQPVLSNAEVQGTEALNNWDDLGALSDEQQRYLGVVPKTTPQPDNYIFPDGSVHLSTDGVTDMHGLPIPQGAYKANVSGGAADTGVKLTTQNLGTAQDVVQQAKLWHQVADPLLADTLAHPEHYGAVGALRGGVQELVQTVPALSTLFGGKNVNDAITGTVTTLLANDDQKNMAAQLLSTFDQGLPTVRSMGVYMQYMLGSLLLGQNGRSMTDKDLEQLNKMFPNPQDMFASAQSVGAMIKLYSQLIDGRASMASDQVNTGKMDTGFPLSPVVMPGSEPNTATQPNAAPVAGEPQEGATATNPQTGQKLVLRGGQWVPV